MSVQASPSPASSFAASGQGGLGALCMELRPPAWCCENCRKRVPETPEEDRLAKRVRPNYAENLIQAIEFPVQTVASVFLSPVLGTEGSSLNKKSGECLCKDSAVELLESDRYVGAEDEDGEIHPLDHLPSELWQKIFSFLRKNVWDLVSVVQTCKYFKDLVTTSLEFTFSFWGCRVSNNLLKCVAGARSVTFHGCKQITDDGLKALAGAEMVGLSGCDLITDKGLKALAGVRSLDISGCSAVTDEALKALAGVQTIDLTGCWRVTDEGVMALAGVQAISLPCCSQITDASLKALAGVHTIDLSDCTRVTDAGVRALSGVHTINLADCVRVTDAGVAALAGAHTVCLAGCDQITDTGVQALAGAHSVDLTDCFRVTNVSVRALAHVSRLCLKGCDLVRMPALPQGHSALAGKTQSLDAFQSTLAAALASSPEVQQRRRLKKLPTRCGLECSW